MYSTPALDEVSREFAQGAGLRPEAGERRDAVFGELGRPRAGRGDACNCGIRRLAAERIGARNLAGHGGIAEDVEQVVDDLEAEPDCAAVAVECVALSRAPGLPSRQ